MPESLMLVLREPFVVLGIEPMSAIIHMQGKGPSFPAVLLLHPIPHPQFLQAEKIHSLLVSSLTALCESSQ